MKITSYDIKMLQSLLKSYDPNDVKDDKYYIIGHLIQVLTIELKGIVNDNNN